MYKKVIFPCILFLLLAAAAGPEVVSAGVDPLASPTPQPTERITAPVITGVNPDAVMSEGNLGDSLPSGSIGPAGIAPPFGVGSPLYVVVKSQAAKFDNAVFDLPQNVEDVNCGPSSLSQALKILDPEGKSLLPTTNQLSDFMTTRGLMYEWGTGVEELAYTAREFGFTGSIPFHNWKIEQLTEYLRQDKPLIVSLGVNGADTPGHFVTLTGISEDGNWITFQDPSGERSIISREKFVALWNLQGSAGVVPQQESSTLSADPMLPWMGIFGAISAMALTLKQTTNLKESDAFSLLRKQLSNPLRKGIGAGPLPPKDPNVIKVPQYETETVYRGMKKEEVEIPIFETKKVKIGIREIKIKVSQYETRRVQVGVELVTKRVPTYKIKKVQTGSKLVKKEIPITRYRTKKVMVWKKYTRRVPMYKRIGSKKIVIGYKNETRWKRVPVTKRIPFQTTKTISIQVPKYKEIRVVSGYKNVTVSVPKFVQKQVQVGHKIINETVPIFEDREVQVGTKIVTREMPDYGLVHIPIPGGNEQAAGSDGSPPIGFSAEIWNSLSFEDQQKLKHVSDENTMTMDEKWWHEVLRKLKLGIVDPIRLLREHPDEVLKNIDVNRIPKILSLSAKSSWDINIFSQDGAVFSTRNPSGLWQLFYMTQKFDIEQKSIVTINPGGLINYYFTSGTGSVKITKNLSYIFGPSEWGVSIKKPASNEVYDYGLSKHMISITGKGISYKWQEEDVDIISNEEDFRIKVVTTRKCVTKTVKFEGIVVAIITIPLVYAGAIWLFELLNKPLLFPELIGV